MSCGTCAMEAAATLAAVGIPEDQVLATWANKTVGMTWEYLPRCKYCGKWVSPRTGVCNYARCPRRGEQVAPITGWPPEGVALLRRKAHVEAIREATGQLPPPKPLTMEEWEASLAEVQATLDAAAAEAAMEPYVKNQGDYAITDADAIGQGSPKEKCRANLDAIRLLKQLEAEDRPATPEEQALLVKYTGWGGLAGVFDAGSSWRRSEWEKEYNELHELLTSEEWQSARASTPNAHYTSPEVIKAMWQALQEMGFEGGNILEPAAGVGHFLGLCPPEITGKSTRAAVELDSLSARITQKLYPNAAVHATGFEKAPLPDNFFDLAISNVPFGDYAVFDPAYKGAKKYLSRSIHNYFFARSLDRVKPGGVVAFITSRYTMDSENSKVREYLASQADLVGAIRLPNTAFKENAGTEVTTDIIFLRKRAPGDPPGDDSWTQSPATPMADEQGVKSNEHLNAYYHQHPEMMLGKMEVSGTMYRGRQPQLVPHPDRDFKTELATAVSRLPKDHVFHTGSQHCPNCGGFLNAAGICNNPNCSKIPVFQPQSMGRRKNGAFVKGDDGKVYQHRHGLLEDAGLKDKDQARAAEMIAIRDAAREVLRLNVEGAEDADLAAAQAQLNALYDEFVQKYGPLSDPKNRRLLKTDPDLPFLMALENYDAEAKTAQKAALFSERTIGRQFQPDHADSAYDALLLSLNESGAIDWQRMQALTGLSEAELQAQLAGQIYRNPGGHWESADEYLSGDVKAKLAEAEAAAAIDPAYYANVEALKAVIPPDLQPSEIKAALGSVWVPAATVEQFAKEIFGTGYYSLQIRYIEPLSQWSVTKPFNFHSPAASTKWGTQRVDGVALLEQALNGQIPTVTDPDPLDRDRRIVNAAETLAAREAQGKLMAEFQKWLWEDPQRAERMAAIYNERFNRYVPRSYDGSHLTLPGTAADMPTLRKHQKDAIWRVVSSGGSTLLGHIVGAGKTFTMIGAGMELRRLGKRKKVMYAVPNHMLEQFGGDFRRMYPGGKILLVSAEDLGNAEKRAETMSRIATEDWDGVVVTHSALEKLPVSDHTYNSFLRQEIDALDAYLTEERSSSSSRDEASRRTIKEMEKAKKRLEAKLETRAHAKKKDETLTWEELGVDQLFVDECHKFKNLYFPTRRTRVAGIPQNDSARAFDMYIKTQYLQRRCHCGAFVGPDGVCTRCHGKTAIEEGGVVFATGTPIANTVAEMFTMQRYLQGERLRELGLSHFDAWAAQFGESVTALEMKPTGDGYREFTRFAKFVNVPELLRIFSETADMRMDPEALGLDRPALTGGKATTIAAPPSQAMKDFLQECSKRADRLANVKPEEDNMLKIVSDANKAALDMRLVHPDLPDDPHSKVNQAAGQIARIYRDTTGVTVPGTEGTQDMAQIVFLDSSIPDGSGGFNVYQDLKDKLLAAGIPREQIAFIHDAKTDEEKLALFEKVNAGKVRVLIGSTEKMGSGTNVQRRLAALHHLDAPWRPADVEQREGRILRQGNINREVGVYRYVTEESFDVYRWQTLESKAKFIAQITSGKMTERSAEDIDAITLGYAEVKALATGNPVIVEKIKTEGDLRKLRSLQSAWQNKVYQMRQGIRLAQENIRTVQHTIAELNAGQNLVSQRGTDFAAGFNGRTYTKREEAGQEFLKLYQKVAEAPQTLDPTMIGRIRGFPILIEKRGPNLVPEVSVEVTPRLRIPIKELSSSPSGNMTRLENAVDSLPGRIQGHEEHIAQLKGTIQQNTEELGRPFEHAEKMAYLESRLSDLTAQVEALGKDDPSKKQTAASAEEG